MEELGFSLPTSRKAMATGNERNSTGKRQNSGEESGVDRLSNLPEVMISHIFSFLPTESAVATSCLSKTWNLRWTKSLSKLSFDYGSWISRGRGGVKFHQFVNMIMLKHSAESIHKFSLKWYDSKFQPFYVNIWIDTVLARNVRVIHIDLIPDRGVENHDLNVPAAFYSCGTLEALKLSGCLLVKPPRVVYLPKLTVLKLHSVRHESNESFRKLISGCPRLESLTIHRTYDDLLRVYTIHSPTLKCLDISFFYPDDDELESIQLKVEMKTPALESLDLHDCVDIEYPILGQTSVNRAELDIKDGIVGLVQRFDCLEILNLSVRSMNGVALSSGSNPFSTTFERLTKLVLEIEHDHWSSVLNLINCCINLEVLDLTKEPSYGESWTVPASVPRCFSSSLKRVFFYGFYALEDEMGMLNFILQHGLLIETVTLWSYMNSRISCDEKLQMLNKVLQLPRASTACKISFTWDGKGCLNAA